MINIAVCDDDRIMATNIENLLLEEIEANHVRAEVEVYFDGRKLLKDIENGIPYDLLYLDIEMEDLNGIILAHMLRENGKNVMIIYVSGYEKYLKKLFEVNTFRFLDKPIERQKFKQYFREAIRDISKGNVYFSYRFNRNEYKLPLHSIVYFESNRRCIHAYLTDGLNVTFYGKLNEVEEKLSESAVSFLRIHQSYLVNFEYIEEYGSLGMKMMDGKILQVSEERQKYVRKRYGELKGKGLFGD